MKNYKLILLDRFNNELDSILIQCKNKKDAINYSYLFIANSMINDLFKITIKKV